MDMPRPRTGHPALDLLAAALAWVVWPALTLWFTVSGFESFAVGTCALITALYTLSRWYEQLKGEPITDTLGITAAEDEVEA